MKNKGIIYIIRQLFLEKQCAVGYLGCGRYLQRVVQTFPRAMSSFDDIDVPGTLEVLLSFYVVFSIDFLVQEKKVRALAYQGCSDRDDNRDHYPKILKAFSSFCRVGDLWPFSKGIVPYIIFSRELMQFRVLSLRVDWFAPIEQNNSIANETPSQPGPSAVGSVAYGRTNG